MQPKQPLEVSFSPEDGQQAMRMAKREKLGHPFMHESATLAFEPKPRRRATADSNPSVSSPVEGVVDPIDPQDPVSVEGSVVPPEVSEDEVALHPEAEDLYDDYVDFLKADNANKGITFREFVKKQTAKEAARWYTAVRPHGEVGVAKGDNGEEDDVEPSLLMDMDHQERINAQEGKSNPSKDDVDYYKWLKRNSGNEEEAADDGRTPADPGPVRRPRVKVTGPTNHDPKDKGPKTPEDGDKDPVTLHEVLEGLGKALDESRREYVRLSSEYTRLSAETRRTSFGGKKRLEAARQAYIKARDEAGAAALTALESADVSPEDIKSMAVGAAIFEARVLEGEVYQHHMKAAGGVKFKRFYDWWGRNSGQILPKDEHGNRHFSVKGALGRVKKSGALGLITFVPGVAAGVAGAVVLGPVAGAVAGAAAARGIARGLVGARISQRVRVMNPETGEPAVGRRVDRVAGLQANYRYDEDRDILEGLRTAPGLADTEEVTDLIDADTRKDRRRNRTRLAGAAAIGAAAGLGGAVIADHIFHGGTPDNGGNGGGNTTTTTTGPKGPNVDPNVLEYMRRVRFNQEAYATSHGIKLPQGSLSPEQYTNQINAAVPINNPDFIAFMNNNEALAWSLDPTNPDNVLPKL